MNNTSADKIVVSDSFGTNTTPLHSLQTAYDALSLPAGELTKDDLYTGIDSAIIAVLDGTEGEPGMQRLLDSITDSRMHDTVSHRLSAIKMNREYESAKAEDDSQM